MKSNVVKTFCPEASKTAFYTPYCGTWVKPEFGNKIAFFGNINVMLMEDSDDSKIEDEIRDKFSAAMPGGGYLYSSDHSIPKDVSFEKYKFVIECVRKYGSYGDK